MASIIHLFKILGFMDNIITKDIPERVEMKVLFSVNQDGIINLERGILRITFNRYFVRFYN